MLRNILYDRNTPPRDNKKGMKEKKRKEIHSLEIDSSNHIKSLLSFNALPLVYIFHGILNCRLMYAYMNNQKSMHCAYTHTHILVHLVKL